MELKELIDLSNKAFQEKNFYKVVDLLKKVIVLQPDRYEIYLRLGLASSSLGNLKEAIDYFEKGASINSNSSAIYCNIQIFVCIFKIVYLKIITSKIIVCGKIFWIYFNCSKIILKS